ncbi:MAG: ATP-dependent helicase [Solibacillus isronensis]
MNELTPEQKTLLDYIKQRLKVPFNEGQSKLLIPTAEPLMAFAVPGSGKTNTLVPRVWILELISQIPGEYIWVVTFTKKAAREFSNRHAKFGKMIDPNLESRVKIKTIHAMCHQYVSTFHIEVGLSEFGVMTEQASKERLRDVISSIRKCKPINVPMNEVSNILTVISWLDNRLLFTREEITNTMQFRDLKIKWEEYKMIYDNFKYIMKSTGQLTQDEVMVKYLELLRKNENVLEIVRKGIKYICVDEFQDTTPLQYEIIKMMKAPNTGITVVGDSDQSIYRWRGATNIVFNFMKDFPTHQKVGLDINYRCPEIIIKSANALIRNNNLRVDIAAKGTNKQGDVKIIPCSSNKQASLEIGNRIIKEYLESNRDNHVLMDKLVLYRNHAQAMFLLYMLASNEVPVNVSGASLPHKDKIVRDIHDIIMMLKNPRDSKLAHKCMRLVSSQIKRTKEADCPFFNSSETEHFAKVQVKVKDRNLYQSELVELIHISNMITNNESAVAIFKRIVPLYMNNYYMAGRVYDFLGKTKEDTDAVVTFLYTAVPEDYTYSQFNFMMGQCEQFLNEQKKTFVGINVLSMHGAKGLEAETVYILDSNGKTSPSDTKITTLLEGRNYAELEDYINEERSLFYVAITRTTKNLIMTYNEHNPSPFNLESGLNKDGKVHSTKLSLKTLNVSDYEIQRAHAKLTGQPMPDHAPQMFPNQQQQAMQQQQPMQQQQHQQRAPQAPIGQPMQRQGMPPQAPQAPQGTPFVAPPSSLPFGSAPQQQGTTPDLRGAMQHHQQQANNAHQQQEQQMRQMFGSALASLSESVDKLEERPTGKVNNLMGQ